MKFIPAQLAFFLQNRETKRNMRFLRRFFVLLLLLITVYSVAFHYIMALEGRSYSWITGFYWTLTVMSTLGFGDVTFVGDAGKLFSIVVLLSGILLLLVMLPFTFIQFFYAPWLDSQTKSRVPRELPVDTAHHCIIIGTDLTALSLATSLRQYGFPYVLLCPDVHITLDLQDQGFNVVAGNYDDEEVYRRLRVNKAAMLVALDSDVRNTNIAFTVREIQMDIPIIAHADEPDSVDILYLAGCSHVFLFRRLLGEALAQRTLAASQRTSIIGRFDHLLVAEAPVIHTRLAKNSLRASNLRQAVGVNIVGIWDQGLFHIPSPDMLLEESAVLLLVGTQEQIHDFERLSLETESIATPPGTSPVIILGGGRVGLAAAGTLEQNGVPYCVVDKNAKALQNVPQSVLGNAADIEVLERAGIRTTPAVIITTHDDDMNIYLTIYCRRLRPDVHIFSRATLDRNVGILHAAGADLVMSYASTVANTIINLLTPGKVLMLNEGLNIFRTDVPLALYGEKLLDSGIREKTQCSVVAVRESGTLTVNPDPQQELTAQQELYLIGNAEAEKKFFELFGNQPT